VSACSPFASLQRKTVLLQPKFNVKIFQYFDQMLAQMQQSMIKNNDYIDFQEILNVLPSMVTLTKNCEHTVDFRAPNRRKLSSTLSVRKDFKHVKQR
jgi:hypothetical protein